LACFSDVSINLAAIIVKLGAHFTIACTAAIAARLKIFNV
jgi:hypothetical protein